MTRLVVEDLSVWFRTQGGTVQALCEASFSLAPGETLVVIGERGSGKTVLARALILRPGYLVCDEISSMLDVSTQAALLEVLAAEQARRPLGIPLITHDRALAHHWCQESVELQDLHGLR